MNCIQCTAVMKFDASFDCEWIYVMCLLPKVVTKEVLLRFIHPFKDFFSVAQTKKPLGLVTRTGLSGEAVHRQGTVGGRLVVWPRCSLDVEHFFFNYFRPLRQFTTTLITSKIDSIMHFLTTLSISWVFMRPWSWGKKDSVQFSGKVSRKHGFLRRTLVYSFVIPYLTPSFKINEICCSETAFAKQRLAFLWLITWHNFLSSQFLFEVRIVTLALHCYFYWLFSASFLRLFPHTLWHCLVKWSVL